MRVIAATNRDLKALTGAGGFREDLYFRLNVVPIPCPPLRERREDIPALVRHFVGLFSRENNYRPKRFEPAALDVLMGRPWRGNIRELRNAVERLMIMVESDAITAADVEAFEPEPLAASAAPSAAPAAAAGGPGAGPSGAPAGPDPASFRTLQEYRDEAEKAFILKKLKEYRWNVSRTAKAIDTPRSNLYKKLEQYGITQEKDG